MSGTEEVITRRSRAERPEREVHRTPADDTPSVIVEGADDQVTPEEALAEAKRLLQDQQKQTADARKLQREADERRRAAEHAAAQAQTGRATDRQSAVAATIEQAKAEEANAIGAYRMARETGNVDAEIEASGALTTARMRLASATAEHEWLKTQPKTPAVPAQQTSGMTEETKRWLDAHPAYHSDRKYRGTAIEAHNEAIRSGRTEGSQEYVEYIDRIMTEEYGDGHGQIGHDPLSDYRQQPAARQAPRSDAAPPSRRASGGGTGGWKTIDTDLGKILYQDRPDGTRGIKFDSSDTHARFVEGAQMNRNYEKDPGRALADYTNEHILDAMEGGDTIKRGDGRIMR